MIGRDIVDRITPGMVEREPETIAAWIDKAVAEMKERCAHECEIVRDSPIECVDPCTEDWIAHRIRRLSPDPNFLERERLKARLDELRHIEPGAYRPNLNKKDVIEVAERIADLERRLQEAS